ncbi:MAG TPA: hypothetical protein VKA53_08400 [Thermoanaerobaculia bacterium]|nr:hypothetical protein [Thermoanaerobaculia bacterium]
MSDERRSGDRNVSERQEVKPEELARRQYRRPNLEVLGDLRDLTLGTSPGAGDSTGNTSLHTPIP